MADDNRVLERLRAIRAILETVQDAQAEHGHRLTRLEHGQADIRRMISHDAESAAEQSSRIDRLADRMTRVERRLELRDD